MSRLVLVLALLIGCNRGAAPTPDAAPSEGPPVEAASNPEATPAAAVVASAAPASPDAAPQRSPAEAPSEPPATPHDPEPRADPSLADASGAEARPVAELGDPTDEGAALGDDGLTDAQRLAFARALEPKIPEAVTIVATRPRRGAWFVLFHVEAAARWRAAQRPGPALTRRLEALTAAHERCEDESSSESGIRACVLEAAPDPALGWEALGEKFVIYELARLEVAATTPTAAATPKAAATPEVAATPEAAATPKVAARLVLSGLAMPDNDPVVPLKLQVFDIDRDGGDEITAVVPIRVPEEDSFTQVYGAFGAIVDARTFTRQFATARLHVNEYNHAEDQTTITYEVKWFAADDDGDGHPDLRVRETHRRDESEGPTKSEDRKVICPYSPEEDRWRCPGPPLTEGLLLPPL